ncbi:MAG: glucan biosynthesis protein D [Gammaproteobacteria bacterium]
MSISRTRRRLLQSLAALAAAPLLRIDPALAASKLRLGGAQPFSWERLRRHARRLAARPFEPTPPRYPKLLDTITYDVYQKIRFRRRDALFAGSGDPFPVEFFHLGRYAQQPVAIHVVEHGRSRRVRYSPGLFQYDDTGLADKVPNDLGFAGFRVMNNGTEPGDWLAFQGASYFRSAGPLNQYGLSARGIAVDTAVPGRAEEFPRFTAFWLEESRTDPHGLTVYALLDGPSVTGAYRFRCRKQGAVVMDVRAELFQRAAIDRLGIAPLTSMYWYSETNARRGTDWRPEIHDSDGLALWTGAGERIWRPLNDPPHVQTNSFMDHDPKGFGLLQRDRNFDHYQDDGVFYNRRPSVWVEPRGKWGAGAVMLVELPTDDEIEDNIVAFWVPKKPAAKGTSWRFDYRLYWVAIEPFLPAVARVVATRLGRPGVPGQHAPRDPHGRKFVIDFTGGPLATMRQRYDVQAVVHTSRGRVGNAHVLKVVGTDRWRASFDLHVTGAEPVDLRCYLRLGQRTLSETWLYQFIPGDYGFDCAQR